MLSSIFFRQNGRYFEQTMACAIFACLLSRPISIAVARMVTVITNCKKYRGNGCCRSVKNGKKWYPVCIRNVQFQSELMLGVLQGFSLLRMKRSLPSMLVRTSLPPLPSPYLPYLPIQAPPPATATPPDLAAPLPPDLLPR